MEEPREQGGRNPTMLAEFAKIAGLDQTGSAVLDNWEPLRELLTVGPNDRDIDARSDVNELQIVQFSRARAIARHFRIQSLNDYVRDMLTLSLSKGRKSRKEFVQAIQHAHMGDGEAAASILSKFGR